MCSNPHIHILLCCHCILQLLRWILDTQSSSDVVECVMSCGGGLMTEFPIQYLNFHSVSCQKLSCVVSVDLAEKNKTKMCKCDCCDEVLMMFCDLTVGNKNRHCSSSSVSIHFVPTAMKSICSFFAIRKPEIIVVQTLHKVVEFHRKFCFCRFQSEF